MLTYTHTHTVTHTYNLDGDYMTVTQDLYLFSFF